MLKPYASASENDLEWDSETYRTAPGLQSEEMDEAALRSARGVLFGCLLSIGLWFVLAQVLAMLMR